MSQSPANMNWSYYEWGGRAVQLFNVSCEAAEYLVLLCYENTLLVVPQEFI